MLVFVCYFNLNKEHIVVKTNFEEEQLRKLINGIYQPLEEKNLIEKTPLKKVIVIAGPTCSGKTDLSLRLAQQLKGEVISADSMQVYRGMDIGTAKVTMQEREATPHHLIDIRDITDEFNVVDYHYEARLSCEEISARNHVPIVCGGSGFYLHAFLYGPPQGPPSEKEIRDQLESDMEKYGPDAMFGQLQKVDPEYAATITKRDKAKIIRALEIITLTHAKVSGFQWKTPRLPLEYDFRCWFVYRPREVLYPRIEARCDAMLKEGLLEEITALDKLGLRDHRSASSSIGYKQGLTYLDSPQGDEDYEKFLHDFKKASRNYAKRQFTWFRKESEFRWLDLDAHDMEIAAEIIMQDYLRE